MVTTRVFVTGAHDEVPQQSYSLAGLLVRSPHDEGAKAWKEDTENWFFITAGSGDGNHVPQYETKNTVNGSSRLELTPRDVGWTELSIVRTGNHFALLRRNEGEKWKVPRRLSILAGSTSTRSGHRVKSRCRRSVNLDWFELRTTWGGGDRASSCELLGPLDLRGSIQNEPVMSSRILPLESPFPPEAAELLAELRFGMPEPLAIFRTLAKNPRVLGRVRSGGLLDRGTLTLRQRELVILRTTAMCGAEYEWGVHVAGFAQKAGISNEQVAATWSGVTDQFESSEKLLFALVAALHTQATIDDNLYSELRAVFSEAQLIELVVLVGFYHMISFTVLALGVALEPWAPRFPIGL